MITLSVNQEAGFSKPYNVITVGFSKEATKEFNDKHLDRYSPKPHIFIPKSRQLRGIGDYGHRISVRAAYSIFIAWADVPKKFTTGEGIGAPFKFYHDIDSIISVIKCYRKKFGNLSILCNDDAVLSEISKTDDRIISNGEYSQVCEFINNNIEKDKYPFNDNIPF
jgi:hypothetical protein